jgi:chitodextrinase
VTLTWLAAHRGDAPLAGYRVYRGTAVFGQVRRRSVTVPLAVARRYSFAVTAVDTRGHQSRRSLRVSVRASHRAPGRPDGLVVSDVSDTGASLAWNAAAAGSAPIVAYRIYRDGAPVEQVAGLADHLTGLVSASHYQLTVAAVDSLGYVGAASDAVDVDTSHVPPGAPTGLTASGVTDTGVSLGWAAAAAGSAPVVGYRVYRDGAPVGQVSGLSDDVTNLAAVTDYSFTVTAVDSRGYEGPASDPAAVHTAMPPPTQGSVHAFLLASTDQSFRDLQDHYMEIGTIYPTYLQCLVGGRVGGQDDPLVSGWARLRRVRVLPRFDCQSQDRLHQILTDRKVGSAVIATLASLAATNHWDGINIDFESGAATDRDALSGWVANLARRFHSAGLSVAVEVSAKTFDTTTGRSGFYDYPALGASADTVFVMNWGLHWSTSGPGALDELWWARQVADYTASMPNKSRYVLGTSMYGIDWQSGGGAAHPGTPLEYADVTALLSSTGATSIFDTGAFAPHFSYTDAAGAPHDVWYTNAQSIAARVKLARDRGLGVGLWRLGREDQTVWADPAMAR